MEIIHTLYHSERNEKYRGNTCIKRPSAQPIFYLMAVTLAAVMSIAACAAADTPTPTARLDLHPVSAWRTDEIAAVVTVEWTGSPDSLAVMPVDMPDIDGVVWSNQTLDSEYDGKVSRVVQQAVLTTKNRTGKIEIPAISVKFRLPGEKDERETKTAPTSVNIQSISVPAGIVGTVATVAVVGAAIWLGLKVRKRRRSLAVNEADVPDTIDKLEQDLASLRRLKLNGDYGAYFMGLLRIAREIEPEAVQRPPLNEVGTLVESARYGGYKPDNELAERAHRAVERMLKHRRESGIPETVAE